MKKTKNNTPLSRHTRWTIAFIRRKLYHLAYLLD